ncbi:nitrous oxide reductase accessory protein NosL [Riemerella columbipharyngis]|uniref:Copper chaperone NosL n=1 Tax=Riemerella columbipharyngis TaxID=1071918 RepID=A0A1G7C6Q8_9FLAO|nr:nitrous oxide reductase accessory protein NosL [Riemerella columbipharyngis]SDE34989.1 copper chaperone NosL [Riemerella columbipharyngis]
MKKIFSLLLGTGLLLLVLSCSKKTEPINFGKDQCSHCKMVIEDPKYGAELLTSKGRVYKFDDLSCMESFVDENPDKADHAQLYVSDFITHELFPVEQASKVTGGEVRSPMGGNTAAFKNKNEAISEAKKLNAELVN